MTQTADAPTQQLPAVRTPGRQRSDDPRAVLSLDVLAETLAGLAGVDDYAPRRLTGTTPRVPVLTRTF